MKISYSWLRDFVDIDVPAEQLARALVSCGLEVDAITKRSIPPGVKAGVVMDMAKHPNADTLSLCTVDIGDPVPLAVVCGAPNVRAGMRVACATIGTVLGPDMTIRKAKLRGVESFGMLCSERELGLSDDHGGIMDIADPVAPGTPLREIYPDDTVFELDITPNRGDCLSVVGVAREIAAAFGKPLKNPARTPVESGGAVADHISVSIKDAGRCPRYMGRLVRGVRIAPSPAWMKNRLVAAGLRPINNVVDVTNYILVEYGQPMHAFDYSLIGGKQIIVRRSGPGQKFTTLDGAVHTLSDDDLLICDAQGGVALAGIMGGAGSQIHDATTDVFLECAYFEPVGIRVSSKRLGVSTESSYRFERGVDGLAGLERALDTAAELIRELGGGNIVSGVVDTFPQPFAKKLIKLRPSRAAAVLGVSIPEDAIVKYLTSLNMPCVGREGDGLIFDVPQFRHDISIEADLIEEVGRLYGYDNIPTSSTARVPLIRTTNVYERRCDALRKSLAYFGFHEIVTNSMTSEKLHELLTPGAIPVKLLNPLNPDMAFMRAGLVGSHLQAVSHNINRKNLNNRLFELGKTFEQVNGQALAREREVLAVTIEGSYIPASWSTQAVPSSFSVLKGVVDAVAAHNGMGIFTYGRLAANHAFLDTESAALSAGPVRGLMGRVSAAALKAFDVRSDVFYAELDVTEFLQQFETLRQFQALPRFPAAERDFCFVMPESFESSVIVAEILRSSDLVRNVTPFDVYRGEKLGAGLKSIAYSVRFQSTERTLTDKEAETLCSAIVSAVKSKYQIALRG